MVSPCGTGPCIGGQLGPFEFTLACNLSFFYLFAQFYLKVSLDEKVSRCPIVLGFCAPLRMSCLCSVHVHVRVHVRVPAFHIVPLGLAPAARAIPTSHLLASTTCPGVPHETHRHVYANTQLTLALCTTLPDPFFYVHSCAAHARMHND
jgi:hypothetical protein